MTKGDSGVPVEALDAQLHYVSDESPGISRRRAGRGFRYIERSGERVMAKRTRERIDALAIPPAWTEVWICPSPRGHIQATGRDERGRKQYIYHPEWRMARDETKFSRMVEFGRTLPRIRKQARKDLGRRDLCRERVLAAVVMLLDTTLIRIGGEEYAKTNKSYGLTTMQDSHVTTSPSSLRFRFAGKGGLEHEVSITDRRLARVVRQCQELPGQTLFQYEGDDGETCAVGSLDINEYIREIAGREFSAKDFRTWGGTVLALEALRQTDLPDSESETKRAINSAVDAVAKQLGNTRAVCRASYIHPEIFEAFRSGRLRTLDAGNLTGRRSLARELSEGELLTLALLEGTRCG